MAERVISRHVGRPVPVAMKACGPYVGIMISRHHAHIGRPPQGFEPAAGEREFGRERDVDEIARDGHVVRLLGVKIVRDGVERVAAMDAMTAAPPIDVADETLRREFPHARRVPGDADLHRIAPANTTRMRNPDANGHERHWILEIHLVDQARSFGGFYERLL